MMALHLPLVCLIMATSWLVPSRTLSPGLPIRAAFTWTGDLAGIAMDCLWYDQQYSLHVSVCVRHGDLMLELRVLKQYPFPQYLFLDVMVISVLHLLHCFLVCHMSLVFQLYFVSCFSSQEYEIDKTLGIKGPEDVAKMGIAEYNKQCRNIVMRYSNEWEVCLFCSLFYDHVTVLGIET